MIWVRPIWLRIDLTEPIKLLDLLSWMVHASRVAVVFAPENPGKILELKEIEAAAKGLGVAIDAFDVRRVEDIDRAFARIAKAPADAIIVLVDYMTFSNRKQMIQLVSQGRWPSIFQVRDFVDAGGLMSYGLNLCNHFRQAAAHVDKILKGRKPADLPVELPTTFELIINRNTAKALGLAIPDKLIALADEVLE